MKFVLILNYETFCGTFNISKNMVNTARRFFTVFFVVTICAISLFAGCAGQASWPRYVNSNYAYSLEYPNGWSVSEPFQNRQMVVIKSPDDRDTISVLVNASKGSTLEQQVNYYINTTKIGSYAYKLVSDEAVDYQGIPARMLEVVYQGQKDSPALRVKEMYIISGGKLYLVRFSTRLNDLSSLSATYGRFFSSFKLSQ
jgi:hypothetical protein